MYISPCSEVEEERLERMLPTIGGRRISILIICMTLMGLLIGTSTWIVLSSTWGGHEYGVRNDD